MEILAKRVNELSESETLAMTRICKELSTQGFDVINLSIGQPDFNTPEYIKDAAVDALKKNFTFYPPVSGYLDLREAICMKLKRDNGLDYKPDQIVVSTGAKQSIANVFLTMVNPGDEVIVPIPYWVTYKELVKLAEGTGVYMPTSVASDFKITPEELEAAITPKSKLFIFSSPCNPTGTVYTREELKGLADVFARHPQLYIISDEIYEMINFSGKHESIAQFENIRDRVIIINGVSKGFAMTGWRLGYMAGPKFLAQACDKLQGQITSGTCTISQKATVAAMNANPAENPEMQCMVKAFQDRRDYIISLIREIPGLEINVPQGAFYVFADCSHYFGKSDGETLVKDANDLSMYLLYKAHVAMVAGNAFGDPNGIRFSYAIGKDDLKKAMDRIREALAKLK